MMSENAVLAEFRAAGALLEGHFVLTSGLHSPFYLQCARVLMDPARAARLVAALVRAFGPALTGTPLAPLALAGALWLAAFAIFLAVYAPILLRPRADGKPG